MKQILNSVIILVLSVFIISCDKDEDNEKVMLDNKDLIGYWVLNFKDDSNEQKAKILHFTEDGKVAIENGELCSNNNKLGNSESSSYEYYTYRGSPSELMPVNLKFASCGKEYSVGVKDLKLTLKRPGLEEEVFEKSEFTTD